MAKRQRKTAVKELELPPSPCELANAELKEKGYRCEVTREDFENLSALLAYKPEPGAERVEVINNLLGLNEISEKLLHERFNVNSLKQICLGCNSYRNIREKFERSLTPILNIMLKYANQ